MSKLIWSIHATHGYIGTWICLGRRRGGRGVGGGRYGGRRGNVMPDDEMFRVSLDMDNFREIVIF
jgi:hypothetical protein